MITKEKIKSTGATFTPKELADFLSSRIANYLVHDNLQVLDPACGEGALLLSIGQILFESKKNFDLIGYDLNQEYLEVADTKFTIAGLQKTKLINENFLDSIFPDHAQLKLSFDPILTSTPKNVFDIVIANPPYVRTQILGTNHAQHLAKKFDLIGRIDLYYPFLIAMTESLKDGGILGVITSNKYLSTKSGESIRKYLTNNYHILELIDLGDTKLFNAAVLPAIFIGKKTKSKKSLGSKFYKIYENFSEFKGLSTPMESIYQVLNSDQTGYFSIKRKVYQKTSGILKYKIGSVEPWEMLSNDESTWISKIDSYAKNKISDFFKVKVGIKSTADKIFISDKWKELKNEMPEDELLKQLISQENLRPWKAIENLQLKVLYPHISVDGIKTTVDINQYPKAREYFLKNEEKLRSRKYLIDAGRKWFELWVPHRPDQWKFPKLVFPDISAVPRFYLDTKGTIVNGNCYWIMASNEEELERLLLIQGIANSNLMTKYHDLVFTNKLYSGRRRYFTQYVERYPLPDIRSMESQKIISIVKLLNNATKKEYILNLETELEAVISRAFGVEPIINQD